MLTDSHCHITCNELYDELDDVLIRAKENRLGQMMIMCTNREEYERALPLHQNNPDLFKVAFGYYPGDVDKITEEDLAYLEKEARAGHLDVLGEIGLDYYWQSDNKPTQKALFERQIELANETNLPISIHMREATKDTLDLLQAKAKTPIIFHCFSGSKESMEIALKMNSLISFAGPITYKNNKTGPECVKACPIDRMLSETDSPYLSPVPKRGKRNEPANVAYTVAKIAELKDMDQSVVEETITSNFERLFHHPSFNKA